MLAHDVRAQNLAIFLVAQNLHAPLGLAGPTGAPVRREREAPHDVVELPLLALILGEPDAGDFGVAVRHARDVVVLDRLRLLASEELGDVHALPAPLVR